MPLRESLRRLVGLPRAMWSTALGHLGLGLTVLGIVSVTAWETELVTTLNPGETTHISGYSIHFDTFEPVRGPNYTAETARFTVTAPDGGIAQLDPERRRYVASGMPTTEAAIQTYGL